MTSRTSVPGVAPAERRFGSGLRWCDTAHTLEGEKGDSEGGAWGVGGQQGSVCVCVFVCVFVCVCFYICVKNREQ